MSMHAAPGSRPWSWPAKRRPKGCCINSAAMHESEVGDRVADSRSTSAAPRRIQLAERLAGWGNGIEVVRPLELRRQLAEIGAQLVEAYAGA